MPADQVASLSPLDSERFGIVVARADAVTAEAVPALLFYVGEHDVEMVIARCEGADQDAARALADAGFDLLETQITYRGPLQPHPEDERVREGLPEDADAVADLARRGFKRLAGHYHADSRLASSAPEEIYVDWSLRGLAGEAADVFYVAELEGRLAAYGLFSQDGPVVTFQLSTVAEWARGAGLYAACLRRGMNWGIERGAEEMIGIISHGNIAPQRNVIKAGLRPVAATSTFHGWRDRMVGPGGSASVAAADDDR